MAIIQGYTKVGVDNKIASRSNMTLTYSGTGTPELTSFPDAKTGDIIERSGDRAQWRVLGNTLTYLGLTVTSVNGQTGSVVLSVSEEDLDASVTPTPNHLVRRTDNGNVTLPLTPDVASSAASKSYVDAAIGDAIGDMPDDAGIWVGTQAQYNALSTEEKKRVCIIANA